MLCTRQVGTARGTFSRGSGTYLADAHPPYQPQIKEAAAPRNKREWYTFSKQKVLPGCLVAPNWRAVKQ